jgi:hypothetical protein
MSKKGNLKSVYKIFSVMHLKIRLIVSEAGFLYYHRFYTMISGRIEERKTVLNDKKARLNNRASLSLKSIFTG